MTLQGEPSDREIWTGLVSRNSSLQHTYSKYLLVVTSTIKREYLLLISCNVPRVIDLNPITEPWYSRAS